MTIAVFFVSAIPLRISFEGEVLQGQRIDQSGTLYSAIDWLSWHAFKKEEQRFQKLKERETKHSHFVSLLSVILKKKFV